MDFQYKAIDEKVRRDWLTEMGYIDVSFDEKDGKFRAKSIHNDDLKLISRNPVYGQWMPTKEIARESLNRQIQRNCSKTEEDRNMVMPVDCRDMIWELMHP